MKLRAKLILPIVIAVAVTGFASFVSLRTMLNGIIHQQAEQTQHLIGDGIAQAMDQQSRVFSSVVDQMALTAQKQAAMLCADPLVLEAYKIANEGDLDHESDPHVQQARQMLRQAMAPMLEGYASQKGSGKIKIHFHLTNAHSLVRLWRDGWNAKRDGQKVDISDDLSSFRRTVVQINQGDHVAIRGIEIGRGGFAIRGLAAIRDASGQHLGSVEVLYPFSDVTDQLAGQTDAGLAVFMQKRNLSVAKKLNDPARFPVLGGQFVRCAINQGDVLEPMIDSDLLMEGLDEVVVRSHGEYAVGAWPIRDFAGQAVGVMVMGADTRSQAQSLAQITSDGEARSNTLMMRLSVGLIVVSAVLALIFAFVLRRVVLKPIGIMVDRLRDIAEGEGDLTRRLAEDSKDEIGDLARWFNLFVNRVHDLVYHVRTDAQEVAAASTQIAASSEQMSSGMGEQALQVQQIASAIEQMAVSVSDVAGKCQQAADESGQAGDTARAGSQVVEQAVEDMNVIRDAVGASSISVTELGKRSEQIGQIIDVINDIADQTNLLALNAAIEAARAGEHGRGFAVVADEVRKLADRTTQATGDVGETIRSIQQETAQAVGRMEHGTQQVEQGAARAGKAGEALNEIVRGVAEVTLLVQGIAAAAQEQSAAAIEISQSVESISGVVSEANESSRQSSQAASQMSCKAESLQQQIAIFKLRDSA